MMMDPAGEASMQHMPVMVNKFKCLLSSVCTWFAIPTVGIFQFSSKAIAVNNWKINFICQHECLQTECFDEGKNH